MEERQLRGTHKLVEDILHSNQQARNSDNILMYLTYKTIGAKNGVNLDQISASDFLLKREELGMPSFETIRRSRQKVQELNPELRPDRQVERFRRENEEIFRSYAMEELK